MFIRLIIAGDRNFIDYDTVKSVVDFYLKDTTIGPNQTIEIVSGCARGVDTLGERYAEEYKFPVKKFPADWDKYGRAAGPIRNEEMAKYATHCICFITKRSIGTRHMAKMAKKYGLILRIFGI